MRCRFHHACNPCYSRHCRTRMYSLKKLCGGHHPACRGRLRLVKRSPVSRVLSLIFRYLVYDGHPQYTPQATTPKSGRLSLHGPDDTPNRNSFDFRTIPTIPQEDSDDILLIPTPRHSQSHSRSRPHTRPLSPPHTPTHPPARIEPNL